jgi:hypothetical protein
MGLWDENFGENAPRGGANIGLSLAALAAVKFYYSHETHSGRRQPEQGDRGRPRQLPERAGCPGDWQPDCLRSWLQDPDGDGIYAFRTRSLPAGDYEVKVAIGESWDENYGAGASRTA